MDSERSIVPRRVAGVSVALAGTGAFLGAGLSAGLAAIGGIALRAAGVVIPGGSVLTAAAVGAGLGALLSPLTALSLLRRVALGKAVLLTVIGMAIGVVAAELSTGAWMVSAAAGLGAFLLVALILRLSAAPRRRRPTADHPGSSSEKTR